MNGFIVEWSFSSSVLLWFGTTLGQVSLLAALALLANRFLTQHVVVRHSLLTVSLLLIVVAPWSILCLQRAGLGVIAITEPTSPDGSLINAPVDSPANFDDLKKPGESEKQAGDDTANTVNTATLLADANAFLPDDRSRLEGKGLVDSSGFLPSTELNAESAQERANASPAHSMAKSQSTLDNGAIESKQLLNYLLSEPWSTALLSAIAAGWLIGCGVMAIRWLVAWTRLQQLIRRSKPVSSIDIESAFLAACRVSHCDSQAVRLVTSPSIATTDRN